jgi:hypothetical protein
MPGVVVTTAVRTGPSGEGTVKAAQLFVVGSAERGPTDAAMLVRGMSEYSSSNIFRGGRRARIRL